MARKDDTMYKYRKLVSLALAFVMMFCFMAMSFSASAEEIQPRVACSKCGDARFYTTREILDEYTEYVGGCSKITAAHYHVHEKIKVTSYCPGCGYNTSYTYWTNTCV